MRVNRRGAPPQLVGDLPDILAASEKTQDLVLPVGKPLHLPFSGVLQHVEQVPGGDRVDVSSPLRQPSDGSNEFLGCRLFTGISGRPATKGAYGKGLFAITAEDEDGKSGMLARDLPQEFSSA